MEFSRKKKKRVTINITSLIDVLFLLLIFLMISSTFLDQPGMKLELPQAQSSEALEQKDYILVISKEGHMYLNNTMVDINELEKKLKEALPQMKDQALILKADQDVTHGIVVRVMDTAKTCGIKKLIIGTKKK